jgi:hypothetical protein
MTISYPPAVCSNFLWIIDTDEPIRKPRGTPEIEVAHPTDLFT